MYEKLTKSVSLYRKYIITCMIYFSVYQCFIINSVCLNCFY